MAITVRDLINTYSKNNEYRSINEGVDNIEPVKTLNINFNVEGKSAGLSEEEKIVLEALNIGIVTNRVLNERRAARQ